MTVITRTHSIEHTKELYGVKIPPWLRAFDCRAYAYFGCGLYGSERAEADLGLRSEKENHSTTPESCNPHIDNREAMPEELKRQVTDMVASATKMRDKFLKMAKRGSNLKGGTAIYLPVAVALSNFGWSIIADKRIYVIQ
jgi:hypothetical protein